MANLPAVSTDGVSIVYIAASGSGTNGDPFVVTNALPAGTVVGLESFPGFNLPNYDEIQLGYTGEDVTTVTYKENGATVATLNLSYTNGLLTGVARV